MKECGYSITSSVIRKATDGLYASVESCKNFPLDPCCRRQCPDPTQLWIGYPFFPLISGWFWPALPERKYVTWTPTILVAANYVPPMIDWCKPTLNPYGETNSRTSEICNLYPQDQCCQPGQSASQQTPLDFSTPGQQGITATDDIAPTDGWIQHNPVNKWQYRQDHSNWKGEQVIPNSAVEEHISREPCPSWKQLFQLCWGVAWICI